MCGFHLWLAAALCLLGTAAGAHKGDDPAMHVKLKEPYLQRMDPVSAPGFVLEDGQGRGIGLADFRGKVVILNFIYVRCKEACPLQTQLLGAAQKQINATPMRDRVQFVTIATDTEDARATAEILRGYSNAHGLDPVNWTFLNSGPGAPNAGINLAKAYGLNFIPTPEGEQIHGVVTHVIDQDGFLQARFHSLKFRPAHLTRYVEVLLDGGQHAREESAAAPAGGSPAGGIFAVGLIALGFLLLSWYVLRQLRTRRKAGTQTSTGGGFHRRFQRLRAVIGATPRH